MSSFGSSGVLEISTVERGVVSLFGVKSALFIAMNNKGRLYGSVSMDRGWFSITETRICGGDIFTLKPWIFLSPVASSLAIFPGNCAL